MADHFHDDRCSDAGRFPQITAVCRRRWGGELSLILLALEASWLKTYDQGFALTPPGVLLEARLGNVARQTRI